jgi:hypothetical protein
MRTPHTQDVVIPPPVEKIIPNDTRKIKEILVFDLKTRKWKIIVRPTFEET